MQIIKKVNLEYFQYLIEFENNASFCLPWYLTWFSHTLKDKNQILRIFDFLICSNP